MIAKEQAATSAAKSGTSTTLTTWWPLAVLVAINVLNFYDRQVAGAVVEPVRKEFHLTDTQIGGLNTAFTLLYGLVGRLVPLFDAITVGALVVGAAAAWTATRPAIRRTALA